MSLNSLLRLAAQQQRDGLRVRGCLIVKNRGSTPQTAGSMMLVNELAEMHGTVGGGCVEAEVRRRAHQLIAADETGLFTFKLDSDYGWDDGLICGGTIDVAIGRLPNADTLESICNQLDAREHTSLNLEVEGERGSEQFVLDLPPRPRLFIAGAGHIGGAVARLAHRMEFSVMLFDDRADLLARYAEPGISTIPGDIAETLRQAEIDENTYCIIVTRGHRHDAQALSAVVERGAKYVGMIGSRRKVKLIFDELRERGVRPDSLEGVHAPIGLDIGAELVDEIAISILAQLIQVRRSERVKPISGPFPMEPATALP